MFIWLCFTFIFSGLHTSVLAAWKTPINFNATFTSQNDKWRLLVYFCLTVEIIEKKQQELCCIRFSYLWEGMKQVTKHISYVSESYWRQRKKESYLISSKSLSCPQLMWNTSRSLSLAYSKFFLDWESAFSNVPSCVLWKSRNPTAPIPNLSRLETTRSLFFIFLYVQEILGRKYLLFSLHEIYTFYNLFMAYKKPLSEILFSV